MIHIDAIRARPTNVRTGQLAAVLEKFGFGLDHIRWINSDDGSMVTLKIDLADDDQADALMTELRMCGFASTVRR